MWRLIEISVLSGLTTAWRFAGAPTIRSPVLEKPTTEGVVRAPSALATTTGSPPSRTETTELVVPRSIPTVLDIKYSLSKSLTLELSCFFNRFCTQKLRKFRNFIN